MVGRRRIGRRRKMLSRGGLLVWVLVGCSCLVLTELFWVARRYGPLSSSLDSTCLMW